MRIGVLLFPADPWPQTVARARHLESLGYAHLWTYDHLSWRRYRDEPWHATVPWLTGLAAATSRIRLGTTPAAELADWIEEVTVYTATHRGLAAALLAGPDGLSAEDICCTDMLLNVLKVLVARASSVGALQAGATAEDLMMLANAIAVANENDPNTARRVLRLALTGIRR